MKNAFLGREAHRQYFIEFVGTLVLVFFAAGSVMVASRLGNVPQPIYSGASTGLIMMLLIWSLADISGAHLNPAYTLALTVFDGFPRQRAVGYVIAQFAGSAAGSALLYMALGREGSMGANLPNTASGITTAGAFSIECFLSFVMMLVIRGSLATAEPIRQFAAIPIGAIIGLEVMLMGPIAGASMNPVRAFGPYLFLGEWNTYWIYLIGPVIGTLCAGVVWNWLYRSSGE